SEVALAREPPQLADARAAVHGHADRTGLGELGQVRVPLVDRRQVERLLQPGVVEVEFLVQLRDEPVRLRALRVQLPVGGRGRWRGVSTIAGTGSTSRTPTARMRPRTSGPH